MARIPSCSRPRRDDFGSPRWQVRHALQHAGHERAQGLEAVTLGAQNQDAERCIRWDTQTHINRDERLETVGCRQTHEVAIVGSSPAQTRYGLR
jgi:hypothetical protein